MFSFYIYVPYLLNIIPHDRTSLIKYLTYEILWLYKYKSLYINKRTRLVCCTWVWVLLIASLADRVRAGRMLYIYIKYDPFYAPFNVKAIKQSTRAFKWKCGVSRICREIRYRKMWRREKNKSLRNPRAHNIQ